MVTRKGILNAAILMKTAVNTLGSREKAITRIHSMSSHHTVTAHFKSYKMHNTSSHTAVTITETRGNSHQQMLKMSTDRMQMCRNHR